MSAWKYCPNCDSAMSKPTAYDIMLGYMFCSNCGETIEVDEVEKVFLIEEMFDDIQKIKKVLNIE